MCPELLEIPFIHLAVKGYGLMILIGFILGAWLFGRLSRRITPDLKTMTNVSLYALVGGLVYLGAVIHDLNFYIWQEQLALPRFLVALICIIFLHLVYHKLPICRYLDALVIGLMLALVFGRLGCFLNGCCYGKPTELPWGVRFPYGSFVYLSQTEPDLGRDRSEPQLELPKEYFGYEGEDGLSYGGLKPYDALDEKQKVEVTRGQYRCLPVHPTQLYSSAMAAFWYLILYIFWRRSEKVKVAKNSHKLFAKPGCTFALMFILYGLTQFLIESIRDDNPFEYARWAIYRGGTVYQNLSIYLIILGAVLMAVFQCLRPRNTNTPETPCPPRKGRTGGNCG